MSSPALQIRSRVPRIAEAALERARLTVVPRRRTRASRVPFVTLVTMLALGGIVGLLLFNTSMQQASFAATSLEDQAAVLNARQQTLRMDLDQLRDPQALALKAKRLGMVPPVAPAFLHLGTGRISGQVLPATRANDLRLTPRPPRKPPELDPQPRVKWVDATTPSPDNRLPKGRQQGAGTHGTKPHDTTRGSGDPGSGAGRQDLSQRPTDQHR